MTATTPRPTPTTAAVRAAGAAALLRTGGTSGVGGLGLVLVGFGLCAMGTASLVRDRRLGLA